MRKNRFYLILFLSISFLTNCTRTVQHADPFYNVNLNDYPLLHLPLINPIEAKRFSGETPWRILILYDLSVSLPNYQVKTYYDYDVEELEKFAVKNGVIMAYSAYVDIEADASIQEDYYHWFVIIPEKEIAEGFHTEAEFRAYIQTLGIQDPDWQTPDEAYKQFRRTGCLEWFPDCDGLK